MKMLRCTLPVLALLTGLAEAAPSPPGGPGGASDRLPPGGGAPPGPLPGAGRPPPPAGYWHGLAVRVYWGGPYWWGGGWGYWPGFGWPGYAWSGLGWPGYGWPGYWGRSHGSYWYVPPTIVYGPPAVVTSTSGVTYIEREPGTVSTRQGAPEDAAAPVPPPPPGAASSPPGTPPLPGTPWWYLCAQPRGAYPYVRECPGGWERLPALPPGQIR